jgi:hypothetical protein
MSSDGKQREHDERLAELLRRVLEEGLDPASREALDMIEDNDTEGGDVEGSVARSQAVIGLLDRSAGEQRADLAGARAVDPRHAAQVRRFVAERTGHGRRSGSLVLVVAALAAAAGFALWLAPWRGADAPAGPEVHLGSGVDVRADANGLAWELAPAPGGWFVVVVRDGAGNELARSPQLFAPVWPLPAAERAAWPADATFEIEVRDGTGQLETTLRTR